MLLYLCTMKKIFVAVLMIVISGWLCAQTSVNSPEGDSDATGLQGGAVKIHQDAKIDELMNKLKDTPAPLNGYRVQLSFGKKEEVNQLRISFLQKYPDQSAYISYLQPNFRLRAGDFRTRMEAEQFKHKIIMDYPNCYIVQDVIELPKLD
jgi:hypothetical protein